MAEREGQGPTSQGTTSQAPATKPKSFVERHQKLIEGSLIGIAGTGIGMGIWHHFKGLKAEIPVALA
jgi:predicted lipid-binding transport protein (Tim44 family)